MANYEDDSIKEKARTEICRFAEKHLPKDRSSATAVYLASTNSRETSLLDKLGIPRANRVILENDPTKLEDVRRINSWIKVVPMSTHDFFKSEAKNYPPFWYCGLDYESYLNDNIIEDLRNIGEKEYLVDGGILYTNVLGMREQREQKENYMECVLHSLDDDSLIFKELFGDNVDLIEVFKETAEKNHLQFPYDGEPKEINTSEFRLTVPPATQEKIYGIANEVFRKMIDFLPAENLQKLRSYAVTETVRNCLCRDQLGIFFDLMECPGAEEHLDKILVNSGYGIKKKSETKRDPPLFGQKLETIVDIIWKRHLEKLKTDFPICFRYNLDRYVINFFRKGGLEVFPHLIKNAANKGYVVSDSKEFYYISNKNSKMMLDIVKTRKINPIAKDTLEEMLNKKLLVYYTPTRPYLGRSFSSGLGAREVVEKLKDEQSRYLGWLEKRAGYLRNLDPDFLKNIPHVRKDLGSSFIPPLTSSTARRLILEDWTNEKIAEHYKVRNWKRIAALRAHLTMGSIKKPEEAYESGEKILESEKTEEVTGSKYLISRRLYRSLSEEAKLRIDYFREEVYEQLLERRQSSIRVSFAKSDLSTLMDHPSMSTVKIYALFDDISLAIHRNKRVTPEFLNDVCKNVRNSQNLVEVVRINTEEEPKYFFVKKEPSEDIKIEVRDLIGSGIPKEEVWQVYKGHFSSRQQFGAIIAWASPNLVRKRKRD